MKIIKFLIIATISVTSVFSQSDPGARQIALSHSTTALSNDVFAFFNNPSGLAQFNWREIGVYYSPSPFGLSELAHGYAAFSEPFSFGTIGAGFMTYGFELYRETKFGLSFSTVIEERFFLGASIFYQNLKIENYGSDGSILLNLGGLSYITSDLRLGFYLSNLARATYGDEPDQIPVRYNLGISYDALPELSLNGALEKELGFPVSFRFGVEYLIIQYLSLRMGTNTEPSTYSAGVGIHYSYFNLDYSLMSHQDLGLTHQVGLIVHFSEFESRQTEIKRILGF